MSTISADYFDGRRAQRHPVTLVLTGGRIKIVGREVGAEFEARRVRVSTRIAHTPRWIFLPGGAACVSDDNDAIDRVVRERRVQRAIHRMEARPAFAAVAVLLVAALFWAIVDYGLPYAAARVAEHVPVEAETVLGSEALEGMDQFGLAPSRLPPERQAELTAKLEALAAQAPDAPAYRLEFRAAPIIGANAFALPSGIVVLTDELVQLAQADEEILAVLAHELGHVRYRHIMRRLLEGSAVALLVAGVTGDVSAATSLAAAAPTLVLQSKFSRDNEREADAYSFDLMRRAGIEPQHFAAILGRMEAQAPRGPMLPTFLSSHPATEERKALSGAN
jgi:Zn-dependent protease with chaperone function